jgi:hypothetical protein
MSKGRQVDTPKMAPLVGADNVENRLVALSMIETERRILEHTASDSVLIHFLKLGSTRNELEIARMRNETELMLARKNSLQQQGNSSDDYQNVINAILGYRRSSFIDEELP